MKPNVTITESGRESSITYSEGSRAITGYQEFGGADVVAIVSMGSIDDWRARHAWAVDRRAQILRYVADEVIRQKAPGCSAEINDANGDIVLRKAGMGAVGALRVAAPSGVTTATAVRDNASWVFRFSWLRAMFALVVLAIVSIIGAGVWIKNRVLAVESGPGAPFGSTLRTDTHLATLISQLQPYTPSLQRDPSSGTRKTLSVNRSLDGSEPRLVRLVRDLPAGSYSLARVIGSDGNTLWIDANGPYGVDLRTYSLVPADDVARANPPSVPRQYSNPPLTHYMAAGLLTAPNAWLGVLSQSDLEGSYRPGRWLRAVEGASDSPREVRRLMRGEFEEDSSSDGAHWRIRSMTPISETEYRNASFLRLNEKSEPLRLSGPDSVLMLYSSGDGVSPQSTLSVARVEVPSDRLLWTSDTGLDRFKLEQILPGEERTVFRGTRPPVPDKVSEPLLVILDHATGQLTTHSLWQ
jgi:hypothetical protein